MVSIVTLVLHQLASGPHPQKRNGLPPQHCTISTLGLKTDVSGVGLQVWRIAVPISDQVRCGAKSFAVLEVGSICCPESRKRHANRQIDGGSVTGF